MRYRPRFIQNRLVELLDHFPVVCVLGARQVGKSTLIGALCSSDRETFVFDPVQDFANVRSDPDFFLQNHPPPLFLDEVQYAPELLPALKRKVDREQVNGAYIITGSQNLAVAKGVAESLAGRVAVLQLPPFGVREWTEQTDRPSFLDAWLGDGEICWDDWRRTPAPVMPFIWRGMHPRLLDMPDHLAATYWQSYFQTYVERDIRSIADVGALQTFGRFFALLAACTGQEVNYNHLGRELGVDRKTAVRWAEIAEATYQWFTLPAFARNPVKRIAAKSKGYLTDTGLACWLQRIASPDAILGNPLFGHLFETFVVNEVVKAFQSRPFAPNLYHYRSHGGAEVDLLLELNGVLHPIEIKATANPKRDHARGIHSLGACFPEQMIGPGLIICATESPGPLAPHVAAVPWWVL